MRDRRRAAAASHRPTQRRGAPAGSRRRLDFTDRYRALMAHYGMQPTTTVAGEAHNNGDVEQAHYLFKQAVDQALRVHGSRDFADRSAYERDMLRGRQPHPPRHLGRSADDELAGRTAGAIARPESERHSGQLRCFALKAAKAHLSHEAFLYELAALLHRHSATVLRVGFEERNTRVLETE